MSLFVRFWGTRGSIPTPGPATRKYGGNTSCVELEHEGVSFVCDGGTGLRELGMDMLRRAVKPADVHFFFSHAHWDHIQGFPFFAPIYDPSRTFHIYGAQPEDRRIFDLLSGQMQSDYFPVNFGELKSQIRGEDLGGGAKVISGVEVRFAEQPHPGRSLAYSFAVGGKKVVYATDSELDTLIESDDRRGTLRRIAAPLVDFVRGADLLICDAQYTDEEYERKRGWGHPRATTTVDLAVQARVKQLALYHHDPMHNDAEVDAIVSNCAARARLLGSEVEVFGAREGMELKIG